MLLRLNLVLIPLWFTSAFTLLVSLLRLGLLLGHHLLILRKALVLPLVIGHWLDQLVLMHVVVVGFLGCWFLSLAAGAFFLLFVLDVYLLSKVFEDHWGLLLNVGVWSGCCFCQAARARLRSTAGPAYFLNQVGLSGVAVKPFMVTEVRVIGRVVQKIVDFIPLSLCLMDLQSGSCLAR